jgi:hypothetical protein
MAKPPQGMALFPFILLAKPELRHNPQLMRHERIHHRQQIELFILPFYIAYLGQYFYFRLKGYTHDRAYRALCFEREAFTQDTNPEYLRRRVPFSFLRYLKFRG